METPRTLIAPLGALFLCLVALAACGGRPFASPTLSVEGVPSPLPGNLPTPTVVSTPTAVKPSPTPFPTPSPTPTPLACWTSGGRFETHELDTPRLPWPLTFRVYLPPCYDAQPTRRYPVLYLLHGQNFSDDQWDRLGVDETLDRLVPLGVLPPILVVMPRERDWLPPAESGFDEALVEDLLPWVDAHYRTLADREHRAIGGLSRGAAWALRLAFTRWDLFGAVGGHSPPVFWPDGPLVPGWLAAIPQSMWPRIYLDIGEGDQEQILASARWLEALLTAQGIPHEWHLNAGRHDEAYWSAHVEEYLRWYTAPWQPTP